MSKKKWVPPQTEEQFRRAAKFAWYHDQDAPIFRAVDLYRAGNIERDELVQRLRNAVGVIPPVSKPWWRVW